jgi:hypothetical protein
MRQRRQQFAGEVLAAAIPDIGAQQGPGADFAKASSAGTLLTGCSL